MIGIGSSLLFDRRAGRAGSPTFNKALVDAWFMSGLSNNDKPSSIRGVKGNEVVLKNFAYSLSSGFGKYEIDFNSWKKENTNINVTSSSITITGVLGINTLVTYKDEISKEWKVQITGLPTSKSMFYRYYEDDSDYKQYEINKNGVYLLPPSIKTSGYTAFICNSSDIDKLTNLTITQLPSAYEGGLVFDGIDDYAYIDNFDTLIGEEKIYTVIGNYTNISTKQSLFFNLYNRHNTSTTHSFVRVSSQSPASININYTRAYTVNFETGKLLYKDLLNTENMSSNFPTNIIPDVFSLNGFPNSKGLSNWAELSQVAYYYLGIYRGILTPEEIETEKERLNEEWLKRKTK